MEGASLKARVQWSGRLLRALGRGSKRTDMDWECVREAEEVEVASGGHGLYQACLVTGLLDASYIRSETITDLSKE